MPTATLIYKANIKDWARPRIPTALQLWLGKNKVGVERMARMVGMTERGVRLLAYGQVMPQITTAFMIERVTKGGVPASSWLGTPIGRAQWARLESRIKEATK